MTREEAWQVERQLRQRYPKGTVKITRVFGGVEVETAEAGKSLFIRAADGSPLLVLLGAGPEPD